MLLLILTGTMVLRRNSYLACQSCACTFFVIAPVNTDDSVGSLLVKCVTRDVHENSDTDLIPFNTGYCLSVETNVFISALACDCTMSLNAFLANGPEASSFRKAQRYFDLIMDCAMDCDTSRSPYFDALFVMRRPAALQFNLIRFPHTEGDPGDSGNDLTAYLFSDVTILHAMDCLYARSRLR